MIGYFRDALGYMLPAILVWGIYLVIYLLVLKKQNKRISGLAKVSLFILGMYLTLVFSVTISPMYGYSLNIRWETVNLIPGKVFASMGENPLNLFGNIVMFVPIGMLVTFISKRLQHPFATICLGFSISGSIEVLQLFLGRGTDIDDLILNTLGSFLGWAIAMVIYKCFPKLNNYSGIILNNDKKIKRDGKGVYTLVALMGLSVIATGFYKRDEFINVPFEEENINIEQVQEEQENVQVSNSSLLKNKLDTLNLSAQNICLMDGRTSSQLYGKEENQKIAPASTTKILTAITILDICNMDEIVTVGREINLVEQDASRAYLVLGNELTIEQLLEGLLLPSGNDAAYVLATYAGRKLANDNELDAKEAVNLFVEQMNKKAKSLGAKKSYFKSPDGYDTEGQYTTAKDLGIIAASFMNTNSILTDIVKEYRKSEIFRDGSEVTWYNTNELLNPDSKYYYKGVVGLKTGSSTDAGKCLVSAVEKDGRVFIIVVMGATEEGRYEDTIALMDNLK